MKRIPNLQELTSSRQLFQRRICLPGRYGPQLWQDTRGWDSQASSESTLISTYCRDSQLGSWPSFEGITWACGARQRLATSERASLLYFQAEMFESAASPDSGYAAALGSSRCECPGVDVRQIAVAWSNQRCSLAGAMHRQSSFLGAPGGMKAGGKAPMHDLPERWESGALQPGKARLQPHPASHQAAWGGGARR